MGLLSARGPSRTRGWGARPERPGRPSSTGATALRPTPQKGLGDTGSGRWASLLSSPSSGAGGDRPGTAPALPASVANGSAPQKTESVAAAYHWQPVQVKQHEQKSAMSYTIGTYVNTLSMSIGQKKFEGATAHLIRLEPGNFSAQGSLWCYLVGESFVVCRGTVVGTLPRMHEPEAGRSMRIARLPAHMRPRHSLQFAALSREAYDVGGHVAYCSHLVTLVVTSDGWIGGVSNRQCEGAIDLSAVRFCIGGGISLMDGVSMHTCDIAGSRMVTLQGTLTERFFAVHSHRPLALLPESCRPPRELPFVVAGMSSGGFHLLMARPKHGCGVGGELVWRDSIWNRDQIHLTGMMFEVASDAVQFSALSVSWTGESLKVFVNDFQNFLIRKYGSVQVAWEQAFDLSDHGSINFTEFGMGCKSSGYVGNATRLWAALDEDRSGEISLDEITMGMASPSRNGSAPKRISLLDLMAIDKEAREAEVPGGSSATFCDGAVVKLSNTHRQGDRVELPGTPEI